MAGYCFRCDEPADGEACPRCGSPLYREQKPQPVKRNDPMTVGEDPGNRPGGPSLRVIVAVVTIALLLVAIAVAAASSFGIA
jgi:hypothetical protein